MPRLLKPFGWGSLVVALAASAPNRSIAQGDVVVDPAPPPHLQIVVEPPGPTPVQVKRQKPPPPPLSPEEEREYALLYWDALRSRNIFIGSTVATAVGAALVFPAEANQCGDTDPDGEMTINRCTSAGKAMVIFGYPLLLIGGISMVASGIVFGVMKGKLRRFDKRAARRESRAVHWDPTASRFVF